MQIPAQIGRGGTSKAVIFWAEGMPDDTSSQDEIVIAAFGAGHPRQVDGLGGADPLTSKSAILTPGGPDGSDVSYQFLQVGIDEPTVDRKQSCGNVLSYVALAAAEAGYCKVDGDVRKVNVWESVQGVRIPATITPLSLLDERGLLTMADSGLPISGSVVLLDFASTAGAVTGSLFPTGHKEETVWSRTVEREVRITVIDCGKPNVFFSANDAGIDMSTLQSEPHNVELAVFPEIAELGFRLAGIDMSGSALIASAVSEPPTSQFLTEYGLGAGRIGFAAGRVITPPGEIPRLHRAFAATGAVGACAAALSPGTVVNSVARGDLAATTEVLLTHPSGTLTVLGKQGAATVPTEILLSRTARHIASATVEI